MDKVYTYLMIMVSISFMLFIGGYSSSGSLFSLVQGILNGSNFETSLLWLTIYGILLTVGAAVAYQSVIFGNASAAIAGGGVVMALFLVSFISDIINIIVLAGSSCDIAATGFCGVTYYIIAGVCTLLAVGLAWSIYQMVVGGGD